jgi:hypothetical protein
MFSMLENNILVDGLFPANLRYTRQWYRDTYTIKNSNSRIAAQPIPTQTQMRRKDFWGLLGYFEDQLKYNITTNFFYMHTEDGSGLVEIWLPSRYIEQKEMLYGYHFTLSSA